MTNFDAVPVLDDWRGGGTQLLGGVRISGWGAGSLFSVVLCDGLKVLESLALCEDAELEFVACYVEEGVFWAEDLAEERVIEPVEPCPRDAHEGELYGEEGDGDLHAYPRRGDGEGKGDAGAARSRVYVVLRGGTNLEIRFS